jgi:hypothetical protein
MATRTLHRRESWFARLLSFLLALVAMAVLAALLALAVTGAHYELTRTTRSDVEAMIAAELPERASDEQIFDFLEARGIAHNGVQPSAVNDARLLEAGLPSGTMTITGTVRNDGYAVRLRDVVVTFVLDAEGLLHGYVVYETTR